MAGDRCVLLTILSRHPSCTCVPMLTMSFLHASCLTLTMYCTSIYRNALSLSITWENSHAKNTDQQKYLSKWTKLLHSHDLQRLLLISCKTKSITSALSIEAVLSFYHFVLLLTLYSSCVLSIFKQMCKLRLSTSIKRICYATLTTTWLHSAVTLAL